MVYLPYLNTYLQAELFLQKKEKEELKKKKNNLLDRFPKFEVSSETKEKKLQSLEIAVKEVPHNFALDYENLYQTCSFVSNIT